MKGMKIVGVKFVNKDGTIISDNIYYFRSFVEVAKGNMVLCETTQDVSCAVVVEMDVGRKPPSRHILCKLDLSEWRDGINRAKKRDEIKAKMDARKSVLEQDAIYELLAKEDSEMAELLAEYKSLK